MVRKYHPDVIFDNRLEASGAHHGSLVTDTPSEYAGDFVSPEQIIPAGGVRNSKNEPVVWEACITMNNNWGFCQTDRNYKPFDMVIKKLVECVSKGGNLLLNVGPDAKGNIPRESLAILDEVGKWMRQNHESVYGCGISGIEKPDYGRVTQKGKYLYYHIMESQVGMIPLTGIKKEQIKRMWLVSTGAEIHIVDDWVAACYPDTVFIKFGDSPVLPDPVDTVVGVELY